MTLSGGGGRVAYVDGVDDRSPGVSERPLHMGISPEPISDDVWEILNELPDIQNALFGADPPALQFGRHLAGRNLDCLPRLSHCSCLPASYAVPAELHRALIILQTGLPFQQNAKPCSAL